jgi:hypothetical protein
MAPKINMISEINQANESLNIVVRVMRMWLVRDVSSNNGPFSLDMILMDSTVRTLLYV